MKVPEACPFEPWEPAVYVACSEAYNTPPRRVHGSWVRCVGDVAKAMAAAKAVLLTSPVYPVDGWTLLAYSGFAGQRPQTLTTAVEIGNAIDQGGLDGLL